MYEQLSRLTPFSQQAAPGLSWRTEIRISKSLAQTDPIGTGITLKGVAPGRAETNIKCPNDKIKTLKRQAYGFRDMTYFKLRLYHLHHQKYSLTG
jgi:hypothetical protein